LISDVLPDDPVPKTTRWNRRRTRSVRIAASSLPSSDLAVWSRTWLMTCSAFSA